MRSPSMRIRRFADLTSDQAYAIWWLRQEVFVVEQECAYPDLDGRDREPGTWHVVLEQDGAVIGTLRALDEDTHWRIGRVALAAGSRGRGLADDLMQAILPELTDRPVVLDAQSPLAGWYATHGFEVDGPEFLEDGIPHLPMRRG